MELEGARTGLDIYWRAGRASAASLKAAQILHHWCEGRGYGYPRCCIAHFCWDTARGRLSGMVRWREIAHTRGGACVPCGVLHAGDSPKPLGSRVVSIAAFNFAPTRAAKRRRVIPKEGGSRFNAPLDFKRRVARAREYERLFWNDGELDLVLDRIEAQCQGR